MLHQTVGQERSRIATKISLVNGLLASLTTQSRNWAVVDKAVVDKMADNALPGDGVVFREASYAKCIQLVHNSSRLDFPRRMP